MKPASTDGLKKKIECDGTFVPVYMGCCVNCTQAWGLAALRETAKDCNAGNCTAVWKTLAKGLKCKVSKHNVKQTGVCFTFGQTIEKKLL